MRFAYLSAALAIPTVYAASLGEARTPLFLTLGLLFLALLVYALVTAHRQHQQKTAPADPACAQIEQHAKKLHKGGNSFDSIRQKLVGAGWDAQKVDLVLHNVHTPDGSVEKLMFYVQDQIRQQKPKEQIRGTLLEAKWPEKLVNLVLE